MAIKTHVVVVDDHVSIRQMLGIVLAREGPYEMVGEAGTGFEALRICRLLKPELVILDLVLPEMNGAELLTMLREELRETRFLIYSGVVSPELMIEALQAKPHGFVHKTDDWAVFREALRAVAAGCCYYTPVATRLLNQPRTTSLVRVALSERERQVLQMIAEGMSNKEMAKRLGLSIKTIEHHRAHIMDKLGMHDVATLTRYALRLGLVPTEA